jgi:hypothetical protein
VEVYTQTLPQASTQWRALLDTTLGGPQQLPMYNDPASAAVAAAMADWPGIHEARTTQRNAAADALVAANNNTSTTFTATDHSGADGISSSAGTMLA